VIEALNLIVGADWWLQSYHPSTAEYRSETSTELTKFQSIHRESIKIYHLMNYRGFIALRMP
jgi:hypothetical protein